MLVSVRVFVCLLRERSALESGEGIIVYSIYLRLRRPKRFLFILPSFGVSQFTILFNTSITPNRLRSDIMLALYLV